MPEPVDFTGAAPILPTSTLSTSVAHYRALGFDVEMFDGAPYAFARRGAVQLHLTEVPRVKPKRNLSAAYVYVDDADRLFAEWSAVDHTGRDVEPVDTEYGLREGAHLDPDNNLLRYGSPL